jgi:hypothetical protein
MLPKPKLRVKVSVAPKLNRGLPAEEGTVKASAERGGRSACRSLIKPAATPPIPFDQSTRPIQMKSALFLSILAVLTATLLAGCAENGMTPEQFNHPTPDATGNR